MNNKTTIYLDTPISQLYEAGVVDKTAIRACEAAKPPLEKAGDILEHLQKFGSFNTIPGCRRGGNIAETLMRIAETMERSETPVELKPQIVKRRIAGELTQNALFDFLDDEQRADILAYREKHGRLPMFKLLKYYLNSDKATRNDSIMCYVLHFNNIGKKCNSLADVSQYINLSRERIRQIIQTYELPEELALPRLWTQYTDHSTYYVDESSATFRRTCETEIDDLNFSTFADVLSRTTMLQNVNNTFLARTGWVKEIAAWRKRLMQLASMPRSIESRISLEGLTMGGSLDLRLNIVVLNQIAPALGIKTEAPDSLILPKNA